MNEQMKKVQRESDKQLADRIEFLQGVAVTARAAIAHKYINEKPLTKERGKVLGLLDYHIVEAERDIEKLRNPPIEKPIGFVS